MVPDVNELFSHTPCAVSTKGRLGPARCRQGEVSRAGNPEPVWDEGNLAVLTLARKYPRVSQCFL